MPLIYCKINFILNWTANSVTSTAAANQATTFTIADTKLMFQLNFINLR